MNDTPRAEPLPKDKVAGDRPVKHKVPAPVVYTVVILVLVVLILVLFPKVVVRHKTIETRFQESLVEVKGNHGDVLEISTFKSKAEISEKDNADLSFLGLLPIPMGTTKAALRVPVTYRFYVLLSDRWQIRTTPETVTVNAPDIRPSLPPAPDISQLEISTEVGWARFNRKDIEERVKLMTTSILNNRARQLAHSQIIRDASRKSVESSLKNWIHWLPEECKNKVFVIKFGDELTEDAKTQPETPPAK